MKRSMFGTLTIESANDDMGEVFFEVEPDDCYAEILEGDGKFFFEIKANDSGEIIAQSDDCFATVANARSYLKAWVSDIQVNV